MTWISGGLWLGSWYLMCLEIFRWEHVTRSLAFNPGPPIPGTNIRVKPGRPLKALFVGFYAAPSVFVGGRDSAPPARTIAERLKARRPLRTLLSSEAVAQISAARGPKRRAR